MKRVMLDIETLSTKNNAAILSVGMAAFNVRDGVTDSFGWTIDTTQLVGHIEPATVSWWVKQSGPAKEFSFAENGMPPAAVAQAVATKLTGADEVWAKDPDFDCVILKNWWDSLNLLAPWPVKFWQTRSVRTVLAIGDALKVMYKQTAITAHNPMEDACKQAREVIAVYRHLGIS